jgi:hypothetical protein
LGPWICYAGTGSFTRGVETEKEAEGLRHIHSVVGGDEPGLLAPVRCVNREAEG